MNVFVCNDLFVTTYYQRLAVFDWATDRGLSACVWWDKRLV